MQPVTSTSTADKSADNEGARSKDEVCLWTRIIASQRNILLNKILSPSQQYNKVTISCHFFFFFFFFF